MARSGLGKLTGSVRSPHVHKEKRESVRCPYEVISLRTDTLRLFPFPYARTGSVHTTTA